MTNEEFYDAEIAPGLLVLAKKCQDRGLSIVALVEFDEEEHGRTAALSKGASHFMRALEAFARCRDGRTVNIDKFMFAMAKDAREAGHSSLVLSQMGVPSIANTP